MSNPRIHQEHHCCSWLVSELEDEVHILRVCWRKWGCRILTRGTVDQSPIDLHSTRCVLYRECSRDVNLCYVPPRVPGGWYWKAVAMWELRHAMMWINRTSTHSSPFSSKMNFGTNSGYLVRKEQADILYSSASSPRGWLNQVRHLTEEIKQICIFFAQRSSGVAQSSHWRDSCRYASEFPPSNFTHIADVFFCTELDSWWRALPVIFSLYVPYHIVAM
jgi:hypothetical protein